MRRLTLALLIVASLGLSMPAAAELCTPDAVPAATLLLPYFEVDLAAAEGAGINTFFSVNNASATAVLAHVTLWSDLSVPVLDFNIYLTGYDVQVVDLRDIIVNGNMPRTASDGQDPTDTISPQGPISQDINFASCSGQLPIGAIGALYTSHMQAAFTGQFSSLLGGCAGQLFGDNIARGYVTVDTVNSCSLQFPGDAGYFQAVATFQNVLWGDYVFVNPGQNFSQGDVLVHIEAAIPGSGGGAYDSFPTYTPFAPGQHTFYARYVAGLATDQREPLPSTYGVRFETGGEFGKESDVIVWRDATRPQNTPFSCSGSPVWYPLAQTQVVVFDEEEQVFIGGGCNVSPCPPGSVPFPAEAQRVAVGSDELQTGSDNGWLWLNLNTTVAGATIPDGYAQAFVSGIVSSEGRFSYGLQGVSLNNGCILDPTLRTPILPIGN